MTAETDTAGAGEGPGDGPSCGTCRHWRKGRPDPMNLGQGPVGECRLAPHVIALPTRGGLTVATVYARVAEDFPACAGHAAAGDVSQGGGI